MTQRKDPYEVLGISRNADHNDGWVAYKRLARLHHPDRNPGDPEAEGRFRPIQEAWNELENVLPEPLVPLSPLPDIHDPDFDRKMEDVIGDWYIANDAVLTNATPQGEASQEEAPQAEATSGFKNIWATVGAKKMGNWTRQRVRVNRDTSTSLININEKEATTLLQRYPHTCAALRVVQQGNPELCLFDALVSRARRYFKTISTLPALADIKQFSSQLVNTRALCIIETAPVDEEACETALRNPNASIAMALAKVKAIAPRVVFNGAAVNPEMLKSDIEFFYEYIRDDLMPNLRGRSARPDDGSAEHGIPRPG